MTRDWRADSGYEILPKCPACYPAEDPDTYGSVVNTPEHQLPGFRQITWPSAHAHPYA